MNTGINWKGMKKAEKFVVGLLCLIGFLGIAFIQVQLLTFCWNYVGTNVFTMLPTVTWKSMLAIELFLAFFSKILRGNK